MRIALILGTFPVTSETFILNQITGLIDLGHDVRVFAVRRGEGPQHADFGRYGLRERTLYVRGCKKSELPFKLVSQVLKTALTHPRFIAQEFQRIRGIRWHSENFEMLANLELSSKSKRYDVIHCHYGPNGRRFLPIASMLQTKYAVHFHGYDLFAYGGSSRKAYKRLFEDADGLIANTEYCGEALLDMGCPREKIYRVPSALDLTKFTFTTRKLRRGDTITLLTVARLVKVKGIDYSIRAVAKLCGRYPIRYLIVGDGEERKQLESLVSRLDVTDHVFLTGACTHETVIETMKQAHIFILSSVTAANGQQDNGPNVIKEAQASGMPVVATKSGAIPEIVQDGISGCLVSERDVDALADKLEFLINHQEIWADMGASGRSRVEKAFDLRVASETCAAVYQTLLEG